MSLVHEVSVVWSRRRRPRRKLDGSFPYVTVRGRTWTALRWTFSDTNFYNHLHGVLVTMFRKNKTVEHVVIILCRLSTTHTLRIRFLYSD